MSLQIWTCSHFASVTEVMDFFLSPLLSMGFPLEETQNYTFKLTLNFMLAQQTPLWPQLVGIGGH